MRSHYAQPRTNSICVNSHIPAWDRGYQRRGSLWGRQTDDLPDVPGTPAVLELGCGNGKVLPAMMHRQWNVTAIDFSSHAVALCRRVPGASDAVHFIVADACCLPLSDRSFDLVFVYHVAGHMQKEERGRMAYEAARVLREGGHLFFRGFGVEDMRFGKGVELEEHTYRRGDGTITHYFCEEEVEELFGMLTPVKVERRDWTMRVRGSLLQRSAIEAIFRR
jgi:SAM-dependent methyltransferase